MSQLNPAALLAILGPALKQVGGDSPAVNAIIAGAGQFFDAHDKAQLDQAIRDGAAARQKTHSEVQDALKGK